MDFRQITQPAAPRPTPQHPEPDDEERAAARTRGTKMQSRNLFMLFNGLMLVGIAILVASVAFALTRSKNNTTVGAEQGYVNSAKYQAVFLSNGQVYFGKVIKLDNDFVRMTDIYYLTQSDNKDSNYNLVKLGCQQIHNPYDAMVINREQVTFWENLQDEGQVVKSIKQFKKQNPNGPDCSQVSNQTQASSSSTQGSNNKP